MTRDELKAAALRALRAPLDRREEADAAIGRLLQPYAARDAKVAENNKVAGGHVRPYVFGGEHVRSLVHSLRREMRI